MLFLFIIGLSVTTSGVLGQDECAGQPNCTIIGQWSCEFANVCWDEVMVPTNCPRESGLVYDTTTCKCGVIGEAGGPCGIEKDCTGVPNSSYPLCEEDCQWYFTCSEGVHKGNTQCSPDLVFDFQGQFCNWPFNVCMPCGTLDPISNPTCEGMELLCQIGMIPEE